MVVVHALSPGALGSIVFQLHPDSLGVSTVSDRTADYDAIRPDVWSHLFFGRGYSSYDHVTYRVGLGPLGWVEEVRYPTYRGTEEVVYLQDPTSGTMLGLRPADGGEHSYYSVGIEHLAFEVDDRDEVDAAYTRCLAGDANIHFPPEEDRDIEDYYAFFVFDPDGIRIEVFSWVPAGA